MEKINKTQLNIKQAEDRQIVHRDYIAHCLRWSHILRMTNPNQTWLDIGCGDFPLAMMLYTNKYKPKYYHGVDMRKMEDKKPKTNFPITFYQCDIVKLNEVNTIPYDNIVCLEMIEHVEKKHGQKVLAKIAKLASAKTQIFISTPVFNGKKAANHVHEWEYKELQSELTKHFKIVEHFGTFASQSDIKPHLSSNEMETFAAMHNYYDSNLLSIMFAPMHPEHSRNVLWRLRIK